MTTTTTITSPPKNIRRVNLRRDLNQIADLVELSFADTLDADGRRFIRQMRSTAQSPHMMGLGGFMPASVGGYVWESDGMVVGNLNTIPVFANGERSYLIANVAVHPDFRGQGIARALTEVTLKDLRTRLVSSVWLQARAENAIAYHLYQGQGFEEVARRTTWHSGRLPAYAPIPNNMKLASRRKGDWAQQKKWLGAVYPKTIAWHLPLKYAALRPGLRGTINRMLTERNFSQWSYVLNNELAGVLAWQSSFTQADWLWLAADPANETQVIENLLPYAMRHAPRQRMVALNYPEGRGADALESIGFRAHQTLVWMKTTLS